MEWWLYIAIPLSGAVAGFINTLAGSGSLITLPLLMLAGLPPTVANGTNRVAILLQSGVGLGGFQKRGLLDVHDGWKPVIPAVLGAVLGAQLAVELTEAAMKAAIAALMIVMLGVILIQPKRWLEGKAAAERTFGWLQGVAFFGIGVYGGFIQAGVGVFLLAGLVLAGGYDLVRANAVKLLVVLAFTVVALVVFVIGGKVDWPMGLLLAAGNVLGAWIATATAARRGARFVRWLLIAVVAAAAAKLLYDVAVG
ncbi:MAG: sulfite exporter TauE/SafE family protein [Phycisphaerae bacterium]|nr:sulfite exporter TauE/SafE family protein [Phycisphaerae bacterium]